VIDLVYTGSFTTYYLATPDGSRVMARRQNSTPLYEETIQRGDQVSLSWYSAVSRAFPAEG
jgi:hypothetical protein